MTKIEYFVAVRAAGGGAELHELRKQSAVDGDITSGEAQDISDAIGRRFSQLNAAAVGQPKPRWDAPVRIPTAARVH